MRRLHDLPVGSGMLFAIVLVAVVAAHAGAWYFVSQHLGLAGTLATVLIAIVAAEDHIAVRCPSSRVLANRVEPCRLEAGKDLV